MSTTKALEPRPRRILDGFPPDTRVVVAGVSWDEYENLVNQVGEARNCRIAFDGKDIEMMSLGPFHERQKSLLDWFIMIVASELKIRRQPMGSTTWKRTKLKRAIESDFTRPTRVRHAVDIQRGLSRSGHMGGAAARVGTERTRSWIGCIASFTGGNHARSSGSQTPRTDPRESFFGCGE